MAAGGLSVARSRSSSRLSSAGRITLQSAPLSTALTPSMARIADGGKVVELSGKQRSFEVGGRLGNVVTHSRAQTVHKGWRLVAVDGKPCKPAEAGVALATAQRRPRYTATFRIGDAVLEEDGDDKVDRDVAAAEEADRLRRTAEAEQRRKEQEEGNRRAAEEEEAEEEEEARRRHAALELAARERAAAEAEGQARAEARARDAAEERARAEAQARAEAEAAAAAEKERRLAKLRADRERERLADLEREREAERAAQRKRDEAEAKMAAELQDLRVAAEERLTQSTGLPPRAEAADPQGALLAALGGGSRPSAPPKKRGGPCDKCDGPHHEDDCPYFKGKKRMQHKDALDKYGKKATDGGEGGESKQHILRSARIVPQPGDGSCLFHSLAYGLKSTTAQALRAEVADFIADNPNELVADNPIKDWVLWDSGTDVRAYAKTMRTSSRWGGAVEIAVCAAVKRTAVHVYTRASRGFARISAFGDEDPRLGAKVVNLHYGGRVHYDALEV